MIVIPQTVTLAVGAVTWLVGIAIVKRVEFLRRYNLPAPVVGGFLCALLFTVLKLQGVEPPKFDTTLMPPLMIGFFASIGFNASFRDLRRGGKEVAIFLAAACLLLVLQVAAGVLVANLLGQPQLFGVLTTAVALVGGPGTALSFAPEFEAAGLADSASIGIAASMLGIVFGGIVGPPVATLIIGKQRERPGPAAAAECQVPQEAQATIPFDKLAAQLIYHVGWVLIIGSVGYYLSLGMTAVGIKLPFYVGAMVVACLVRNIDEYHGSFNLNKDWVEAIGGACLVLFISVSMMTIQLWSIAEEVGPLLISLAIQSALVSAFAVGVIYRLMGKDYDAAVMSGGMIGFMMGTTANALATMKALCERFGPAKRAFLVVPVVGACFIDFINAIVISVALTLFR